MCNSVTWQRQVRNGRWIPVTNSSDGKVLSNLVDAPCHQYAEPGGESGQNYTLYI